MPRARDAEGLLRCFAFALLFEDSESGGKERYVERLILRAWVNSGRNCLESFDQG
jgi:hypothetical protein